MKISAVFNSTSNQFEVYNGPYPISPLPNQLPQTLVIWPPV